MSEPVSHWNLDFYTRIVLNYNMTHVKMKEKQTPVTTISSIIRGFNLRNFGLSFLAYQNNFVGSVYVIVMSLPSSFSY